MAAPRVLMVTALAVGLVSVPALAATAPAADPPWSEPLAELAAAVECPATFGHPEREPVLLVHGTMTTGREQWSWNYQLLLAERGFDACLVTYPDRGLDDQQRSAEYVAYAVLEVHRRTGRSVDVVGHSQGAVLPRWAVRWWPSVEAVVDDAVLIAPPSHGVRFAERADESPVAMMPSFHQFDPGSRFVEALNRGDETPGDVSWTVLYAHGDQLVQPSWPEPTAALDWGLENPLVANIAVDEVCPGRVVEHLSIGTTDRAAQELVLDALVTPGPADPARVVAARPLCSLPDQYVNPGAFGVLVEQAPDSLGGGFPTTRPVREEPPLRPYAGG